MLPCKNNEIPDRRDIFRAHNFTSIYFNNHDWTFRANKLTPDLKIDIEMSPGTIPNYRGRPLDAREQHGRTLLMTQKP